MNLKKLAASAGSLEELADRFLPALKSRLRAEAVLLASGPVGRAPTQTVGDVEQFAPERYFSEFAEEDPVHRFARLSRQPVLAARLSINPRSLDSSRVFSEYYTPRGMRDLIVARLHDGEFFSPDQTLLVGFRSPRESLFGDEEVRLVEDLTPALRQATAMVRPTSSQRDKAPLLEAIVRFLGDRALMVFSDRGELVWLSPRARQALGPRYRPSADVARRARDAASTPQLGAQVVRVGAGAQRLALNVVRHADEAFVFGELIEAEALTAAEARVFDALGRGLSNAEIAASLHLSVATVKTHVHRILDKLGVASRVEAALLARGRGHR